MDKKDPAVFDGDVVEEQEVVPIRDEGERCFKVAIFCWWGIINYKVFIFPKPNITRNIVFLLAK